MHVRSILVIGWLFLPLANTSAWSQEQTTDRSESSAPASNIEGWHESERDESVRDWTWFGMGYEFRSSTGLGNSIASGIPIKRTNGKK